MRPFTANKDSYFFSYKNWIKSEEIVINSTFYCPGSENISHNNFIRDNFLDIDDDFSK